MASNKISQFEILASGIEVDGHPLAGGIVRFYGANSTTLQAVYDNNDYTGSRVLLTLDGQGRGFVYGFGTYDITIHDALDSTLIYTFTDITVGSSLTASLTVTAGTTTISNAALDYIFADCTSGAITILLPSYALFNTSLVITKTDGTANAVTIDAYQTEQIDSATTYTLTTVVKTVTLIPDPGNSKWVTAGTNYLPTIGGTISGDLAVSGTLTATLVGNVTGNITGNVTGAVTGNVTGNVSGSSGSTTGNAATATSADKLDGKHWVNIADGSLLVLDNSTDTINLNPVSLSHVFYRFSVYSTTTEVIYAGKVASGLSAYIARLQQNIGANDVLYLHNYGLGVDATFYYTVDVWE